MRIRHLLLLGAIAACHVPPTELPPRGDAVLNPDEGPAEPAASPQVISVGMTPPTAASSPGAARVGTRPRAPDPATLPPTPAVVLVHVDGPNNRPQAGARLRLGVQGRVTDDAGDARFLSVDAGRHVLDVDADGFAQQVRFVELESGDEVRVMLTLHPRSAPQRIDAAAGGVAVDDALTLEFEPGGLRDVGGAVHEGPAQITLTVFGAAADDDMRAYPAPLVGEDVDGVETALQTFGAFEAEVVDEEGRLLTVGEGHVVEARLPVPAGSGLAEGELIPMWTLDPDSGTWREAPGVLAEVVATGDGLEMVAQLPHLSIWNFDYKGISCCFRVTIDPAGRPVGEFMVEIVGPSLRTRRRPVDTEILIIGLRCGQYTVRLFLNGQALDEEVIPAPAEMGAGGNFGCGQDAPNVLLEARGDDIPQQDFGGGPGGAEVVIMAGTCPARDLDIVVRDPEGDIRWETEMAASVFLLDRLDAGTWSVEARDPDDGEEVAQIDLPIESSTLYAELQVSGEYASPPPGGCRARPCRGAECNSCVEITVQDFEGNPLPDVDVNFFQPINIVGPTDGSGRICGDADGWADRETTALPEGALPVAMTLPRGARCESGGCARRTVVMASSSQPCPPGTARARGDSRRMGLRDPGYTPTDSYRPPFDPGPGTLRIQSIGAAGSLPALELEQLVTAGPFGFVQWNQDDHGREAAGATNFRAEIPGVMGIGFAFDTTVEPLSLGAHALGAGPGQLPLEVRIGWMPSMAEVDVYEATGGSAEVRENARGRRMVDFDVQLAPKAGAAGQALRLVGTWWAKLLTRADTPNGLFSQRSHHQNGTSVRVITADDSDGVVYGPAGQWSATPQWPLGELQYCVPDDSWFMLVGEAWPGTLKPFTPLYTLRELTLVPWGNDSAAGAQYASTRARWWDRTFIESMYRANGLGHVDLDEVATLYGTVMRLVDGEVEFVTEFAGATLTAEDEPPIEGLRIRADFRADNGPGGSAQFVFMNVPPRPVDSPYRLEVRDDTGQVMPGYTQLVAVTALRTGRVRSAGGPA